MEIRKVLFTIATCVLLTGCGSATEVLVDGDTATITTEDYKLAFSLYESERIDAVATMVSFERAATERFGASAVLHYLDQESADIFEEDHGKSANCPAPFFNKHADQMFLIPADVAIDEQLKAWDLKNWQNSNAWENVSLEGRCVEDVKAVVRLRDGASGGSGSMRGIDNCKLFVIDSFSAASRY